MADRATIRRRLLEYCLSGLRAVEGGGLARAALDRRPMTAPVWICAIGKAAEAMALGASQALPEASVGGLLITKTGHFEPHRLRPLGVDGLAGGHPIPTQGSLDAGARLLADLAALPPTTSVLFLISGGASSLVEVPVAGLGLADLQRINQWLLGSGLPIAQVNWVRKSVSRIKGGGLLAALDGRAARVLAISDVPGDDPRAIGSGLLVPEPDLAASVAGLDLPGWLRAWVEAGLAERGRLPAVGPAIELVGSLAIAKAAVAEAARSGGESVRVPPGLLTGDAEAQGRALARQLSAGPPGLSVWGGETTVCLPQSPGRGGRNQHLALAAAIELAGHDDCLLLSLGTDGSDGPTGDAGALVDGGTLARAAEAGLDAREALARADAGGLLEATGDLIRTGPTGTNVMDLVLGLRW